MSCGGINPALLLDLYRRDDWSDLSASDKAANVAAVKDGTRIFSSYKVGGGKVWVITEADRSSTCVLLGRGLLNPRGRSASRPRPTAGLLFVPCWLAERKLHTRSGPATMYWRGLPCFGISGHLD